MSKPVVMPQMGESVAEGTIVRWLKKVGDAVERDEPLFEISTDKVDAEIPSPAAGVVTEIRAQENETVPINTIVAVIGAAGAQAPPRPASETPSLRPTPAPAPRGASSAPPLPTAQPQADGSSTTTAVPSPRPEPVPGRGHATTEEAIRQRSSPLVRKIAKEHNVNISQIPGTGIAGRVTKDDILGF